MTKHPALDDKTSPDGANGAHHKSLMAMMIDKEGHAKKKKPLKIHKLNFIQFPVDPIMKNKWKIMY